MRRLAVGRGVVHARRRPSTSEGAGQSVSGTAVDNAGNSASASTTVNIDKTAPTISGARPGRERERLVQRAGDRHVVVRRRALGCRVVPGADDAVGRRRRPVGERHRDRRRRTTADSRRSAGINIDQTAPTITRVGRAGAERGRVEQLAPSRCTSRAPTRRRASRPARARPTRPCRPRVSRPCPVRSPTGPATRRRRRSRCKIDTIAPGIIGCADAGRERRGLEQHRRHRVVQLHRRGFGHRDGRLHRAGHAHRGRGPVGDGHRDRRSRATRRPRRSAAINVDETAPTLTGTPTTAPNANGWYNGPVTIHWTCSRRAVGDRRSVPARLASSASEGPRLSRRRRPCPTSPGNSTTASSAPVQDRPDRAEHDGVERAQLVEHERRRSRCPRPTRCRVSRRRTTASTAARCRRVPPWS